MRRRILDVTSYTTLDYVETSLLGPDWTARSPAVLDVSAPDENGDLDPETVTLSLEVDPVDATDSERQATRVELTPAQARTIAEELESTADRVESEDD